MFQPFLKQKTAFKQDWLLRSTPNPPPFSHHFQYKNSSSFCVVGGGLNTEVDVTTVDHNGVRIQHGISLSNQLCDGVAAMSGQVYDGTFINVGAGVGNSPFFGHLLESQGVGWEAYVFESKFQDHLCHGQWNHKASDLVWFL
jgi:hypothetical protein